MAIEPRFEVKPIGEHCPLPCGDFSEGLAAARFGDLWGFIGHSGNIVIEPKYTDASGFSEGLAAVKVGGTWGEYWTGQWGYIDKTGQMVIDPQFRDAWPFRNGVASVCTWSAPFHRFPGYIDKIGNFIWDSRKVRNCPACGAVLIALRIAKVNGTNMPMSLA